MPPELEHVAKDASIVICARAAVGYDDLLYAFPTAPGNEAWLTRNIGQAWDIAVEHQPDALRPPPLTAQRKANVFAWV